MDHFMASFVLDVISTIAFTFLGCALMWGVWKLIDRATPFSIIKEIEEDQNIALAILFGCIFLSIALIIAAVIIS